MAVYAVGDLQGCLDELRELLDQLNFDPATDQLWLVGDLVNRGPKSLETLRFVHSLGTSAITVLGNHDLHLLALALVPGNHEPEADLQAVLNAPDSNELVDWLRMQPLLHYDPAQNLCLVHAGVYPGWTIAAAAAHAAEVENALRSDQPQHFLSDMYGTMPDTWQPTLTGNDRLRFIVNSFTRMRYCRDDDSLDFTAKLAPDEYGPELQPWFRRPGRANDSARIVFGHWSTLGYVAEANVIGLDTGCVWGGELTAIRLDAEAPPVRVASHQPKRF